MSGFIEQMGGYFPLIFSTFKALVVLVIGWTVAGTVSGIVRRRLNAVEHLDPTVGNFVASLAKWVILLMVLVDYLSRIERVPPWHHHAPLWLIVIQASSFVGLLSLIAWYLDRRKWILSL